MDTKGDLASVIRAVADGTPVEWSAFDGPADESVVSVLNQLRTIATIAGVHGTLNGSAAAPRPASPEPLQTWGPLTVLQRIGEGSYGVVYRAWDSRLDREVALKLLRTDHPGDGADSPAVHEGRLLARVRHPNVVTVYGADRIDGRTGIWMEFVDGRTLEEIVGAEGPLPSAEAQRIIQDLASGLAAVHDAGILHRDVKAQNVIRQDDGRVVLMDFGSGQSREEEQQQAAGTPLYVAPEVLGGAPASVQSDIYSLGVLLYYLLTWRYPRSGTTVAELKRLGPQAWPSLRELQPEVPANVSDAVDRALAPPQARLRTAREFEAAVRPHRRRRANIALVATLVCAAMLATGAWVMRHGAPSDSRPARVPAVIVARFDNDTGDPALSAFVEGTVERELGNAKLARPAPASRVASTLALMRHAPETRSELPVAREVAVRDGEIDAVIGGRVERVGSQLVVNVEAIDPADGALLASAADRAPSRTELTRVLRSQTVRLGQELATRIVPRLGGPPLNRVTTSSLTALRSYTQAALLMGDGGRQQWDNAAARRHLDDALRADPQFASAHLLLAWAILNDSRLCGPCPQVSEVLDHGDRALALLDGVTTVERYFITGSVHDFRARFAAHTPSEARLEREQAIADWEKVLEEQPEHPWALNNILQRAEADGLTATTARHLVELSDLHPDNFLFAVHAALAARQVDDEVASRRLRVRAEGLMTTETEARSPEMAARLRLLPIQDAWLRDDPGAVLAQLQSLETDTQRHRPNQMDTVALFGFYATLGLGRLHDAETRVSRLRTEAHDVAFIRLLKERRDPTATRRFVETRLAENHAANLATALAENGFVDVASRLLQNRGTSAAGTYEQVVEVAVAAGQHKPAEVWRLAARALRLSPFGDRHIQISMMAADALVQTGRLDDAIAVLETTTAHRRQSAGTGEHRWIDARAQLASLYRRVGRVQDASRIETHLLSLLALADADYPLLAELRGRNAGH